MGNSNSAEFNYVEALSNDSQVVHSYAIDEAAEPGYGIPRRSAALKPEAPLASKYVSEDGTKTASTLWEIFEMGHDATNGAGNFLGTRSYEVETDIKFQNSEENRTGKSKSYKPSGYKERPDGFVIRGDYVWDTYSEARETAIAIGAAFKDLGAEPRSNIGIFSVNRAEWTLIQLGIMTQAMRITPLYATLGPDAIEYIINHAETPIVTVSKENLPSLLKTLQKIAGSVKHIVVFDAIFDGKYGNTIDVVSKDDIAKCAEFDIQLHGLSQIIARGAALMKESPVELVPPTPEDIAYIMYTSGTTGTPKGAMILHKNVVAGIAGIPERTGYFNPSQVYFSYLPLAHIFESVAQGFMWSSGSQIAFSQGDIRRLADDLQTAQPHMLAGVPRVFQKFHQNVWATIDKGSWLKRWYINRAYNYQVSCLRSGQPLDPSYDSRVFTKIRAALGLNRIRVIVSGAAPTPPYICEFLRVVTNAHVGEGYGLTETCAGTAISGHPNHTIGHVGSSLVNNMIRLADIDEMGYKSDQTPPTGEVLVHSDAVFEGYYKNEEGTTECFFIDSQQRKWFRTGDVGRWNANGTLSIIDRKKNLVKLAQGEYLALERVEDLLSRANGISQLWVYANSYKSMAVAILVPDWQYIYNLAVEKGWWKDATVTPKPGDHSDAFLDMIAETVTTYNSELVAIFMANLKQVEGTLLGFEKVKAIALEGRVDILGNGFTEEEGTLTPTMKKKRKPLVDKYLDTLKQLYTSLGEPPQDGENW